MKLYTYLQSNELTYEAFARLIDMASARTVQRYVTSERFPRPAVMSRIAEITGGQVTAADFYDAPAALPAAGDEAARAAQ